jgi:hypothetical protein
MGIFKILEEYNMQNYYHKEEHITDHDDSKIMTKLVQSEVDSGATRHLGHIISVYKKVNKVLVGTGQLYARCGEKHFMVVTSAHNVLTVVKNTKDEVVETHPDEVWFMF